MTRPIAAWRARETREERQRTLAALLCVAAVAVLVFWLVPMPPA